MTEPDKSRKNPETVREIAARYERALDQASRYFMGKADVQKAARRIANRLRELGIPYAIAGGLSVSAHGHVRVTQDVDVLLTPNGLERFKQRSLGHGWVEQFPGSKGVRDTQHNVRVDFLLTGEYPGDGESKPVRFPDPADVALDVMGESVLALPTLIELKLASGMTAPERPRDLDDVIQLIQANQLPQDYSDGLSEYVRSKYHELWKHAQIQRDQDY
ncbi:MAG: hypothetical protein ACYTGW_20070 [Planctomycetota bacterium]